MAKCNRCDGGTYMLDGEENTCYHCEGTGQISEGTAQTDLQYALVEQLAAEQVRDQRRVRDNDPNNDGENWAFMAAENMLSTYDYTQECIMARTEELKRDLSKQRVAEGDTLTFSTMATLRWLLGLPAVVEASTVNDPKTPTDEDPRAE